ncbi:glycosyltransferase family 39 protein [Candidatus Woesearchaeota archaeon]|nr:glycosyltransferase family 39 protein [Candidatus Woesearchaeota archaeon]
MNKFNAAAAAILIIFAGILAAVANEKAATFEENNRLAAGYYFLETNDYRMGPGHPPLTHKIAALPMFLSQQEFPHENTYCRQFLYYGCAQEFLYNSGIDAEKYIFFGRLTLIAIAMLAGLYVYRWAKELYGSRAGLTALILYAFSPAVLGWSALLMTDFAAAAFSFISLHYFWKLMRQPGIRNIIFTGTFFGLALSSKFAAALFLPIFFCMAAFWFASKKPYSLKQLKLKNEGLHFVISAAAIMAAAFLVLWAAYGFDAGSYASGAPQRYIELVHDSIPTQYKNAASFVMEKIPLPFPSFFVGVSQQAYISATSTKPSFILGEEKEGSVWYFHILEMLVKLPAAFLLLIATSVTMLIVNKKTYKHDLLFVLTPALIYFTAFATIVNIGSGIQHILPVLMLLFVFAGRTALTKKPVMVYALLAWYVIAALTAFPHYIAYFNEFVDDDEGYKYFLGANLDLGQDLKGLEKYESIKLSYFGTTDPAAYVDYEYMPSPYFQAWVPGFAHSQEDLAANYTEECGKETGLVAVSITNKEGAFMQNKSCYEWLSEYEPVEIIGHTIFVYDTADSDG